MNIINIFKRKKENAQDIKGEDICKIYYLLKLYQDNSSPNIAVIKNKKKFNWQIKVWTNKLNKIRGDCVFKIRDNMYRFIIDEQEVNIIYIDNLQTIEEMHLKYRKYL